MRVFVLLSIIPALQAAKGEGTRARERRGPP